ncbi:unnamed protein product [Spirodela intermedia]|uniref:Uncharacterized protein n=1 Tax=Spirodela intermedia TaxID=51605 RepID=A0A7I8JBS7_SPIIN|nr:unnamed protein product [Spirodela intermedia]CAA6667549.1 unnamed protein product [Spirodela intermedia]
MSAPDKRKSGGNRVPPNDSYVTTIDDLINQIKICKSQKNRSFILRSAQQEEALHRIYNVNFLNKVPSLACTTTPCPTVGWH